MPPARSSFLPMLSLLAAIAAWAVMPAAAQEPRCGINYSFVDADLSALDRCVAGDAAATVFDEAILGRWTEPNVARKVRADLRAMAAAGFRSVRVMVFFGTSTDPLPPAAFGYADAAKASAAVAGFLRAARSAGFEEAYVVFGPLAFATPGCRRVEFGDCFDPRSVSKSAAFTAEVAAAAVAAFPPTVIDFHNEGCVVSGLPRLLARNMRAYNEAVAAALADRLPEGSAVTLSIEPSRGIGCVRYAVDLLDRYGFPGPVDFHVYDESVVGQIPEAARIAAASGRELVIGEMWMSGRDPLHAAVADRIRALPPGTVDDVMFWPSDGAYPGCHVSLRPPYAPPRTGVCRPR